MNIPLILDGKRVYVRWKTPFLFLPHCVVVQRATDSRKLCCDIVKVFFNHRTELRKVLPNLFFVTILFDRHLPLGTSIADSISLASNLFLLWYYFWPSIFFGVVPGILILKRLCTCSTFMVRTLVPSENRKMALLI